MIAYEVPLDPLSLVDFLYWPYTVLLWPGLMVLWYLKSQVQQTSCPCKELELIAVPLKVNATNDYQEEISNRLDTLCFVNRNPSVRGTDCVKPQSITKYLNQLSIVIGSLLIFGDHCETSDCRVIGTYLPPIYSYCLLIDHPDTLLMTLLW